MSDTFSDCGVVGELFSGCNDFIDFNVVVCVLHFNGDKCYTGSGAIQYDSHCSFMSSRENSESECRL